ncbi:hypothetical protein CXF72_18885 [Psychromonas sp. MB-3u-54]|uniref:hypothetical protein n=1 Tax=Psychromonas sp. MB-3u-54 TaxID=2058319 RepID=UPI000C335272|nr:hypothetical protein [Psychromonas sp. MB-3u-54]PKH01101.1 hypothetical protein CXF72_18885 [Psychromonas sp. MB-3u-54]
MKFFLTIFVSSAVFILSGCGSSSDSESTFSSHCSDMNEYSKESTGAGQFIYKFKRNDCNNLIELQSSTLTFNVQKAYFTIPEGTFKNCGLMGGPIGSLMCSRDTDLNQYLTFDSVDGNKQITYFTQLDTNTISEDIRYFDEGVEVDSDLRYLTPENPNYDYIYQRIFNSASFFIEATKNATLILPKPTVE